MNHWFGRCHFCKSRIWPWQRVLQGWHMGWHLACWHTAREALLEGKEEAEAEAKERMRVARQQRLRAEEEDRL